MDQIAKYMRFSKDELSGVSGGQFLPLNPSRSVPYGYEKRNGEILPHSKTAPVVQGIFEKFVSGETFSAIARNLSAQEIPTPSMEKQQKSFSTRWSAATVRAILSNPFYKGAQASPLGENTPLVEAEIFEDARRLLERSALRRRQEREHLLSGMVFCGDCGAALSLKRKSEGRRYFVCSAWSKKQREGICSPHSIREEAVIHAVLTELYVLAKSINTDALMTLYKEKECNRLILGLKNRIEDSQGALVALYKEKCRGVLAEEEYTLLSSGLKKEIALCESQLESFSEIFDERVYYAEVKRILNDILNFEIIHKSILEMLVRRIRIYENDRIVIEFNFTEP